MEIPRRGKFYQGHGLKHTSDIYMCSQLKASLFVSVPTQGVTPGTYKNKQTNKQTCVHPPPPREHLRILSPSLQGMYSGWPATFNRHSLVIRRINFWPLVLTWMMRTCLSWSGNTSSTQPRRHWPHGAFWSTTSTTSLTFRFFFSLSPFLLHVKCWQILFSSALPEYPHQGSWWGYYYPWDND